MDARVRVLIHGRVQGVGFRFTAAARAQGLGLTGWVGNLADGSVEAVFEGSQETLEETLQWCHRGPRTAKVDRVDVAWESGPPEYKSFDLRVDG